MKRKRLGMLAFICYALIPVAANYAISHIGVMEDHGIYLLPVWSGIYAPSGVYVAGLAFSMRDAVQELLGRRLALVAILLGACLSALFSPGLALASGLAFLLSEGADFAVYTPLRDRGHQYWAVGLSNTVGLLLDSFLFLTLAQIPLAYFWGQAIGKGWMTLLALILVALMRREQQMKEQTW